MIKMSKSARHAASGLAVAYSAYQMAREKDDDLGVVVWGNILIEAQDETGIMLTTTGNVRYFVNKAREHLATIAAIAA